MSGSVGAPHIQSREDYDEIFEEYKKLINSFPGFVSMRSSGSYISNKAKQTFGDMDIIVELEGYDDKKVAKRDLADFLVSQPKDVIVPFESEKYKGKRYMLTGEIVTVGFKSKNPNLPMAQIDNMISLTANEADFKSNFLNLPASKQGLILGLTAVSMDYLGLDEVLNRLNVDIDFSPGFRPGVNLSSKELSIREETYKPGTFKRDKRNVLWTSTRWEDVENLLKDFDLNLDFESLLHQVDEKIKDKDIKKRISGVLSSMVSVKSGEVGTEKGRKKQQDIDLANQILSEEVMTFSQYLDQKEKQEKENNVLYQGRFQPPTKAHIQIISDLLKVFDNVYVAVIKGAKTDIRKSPFSKDIQEKIFSTIFGDKVRLLYVPTGYIPDILEEIEGNVNAVVAGTDRVDTYEKQLIRAKLEHITIIEIPRTDEDISASKLRQALIDGDENTFKQNAHPDMYPFYDELKQEIIENLKKETITLNKKLDFF